MKATTEERVKCLEHTAGQLRALVTGMKEQQKEYIKWSGPWEHMERKILDVSGQLAGMEGALRIMQGDCDSIILKIE